jgi:hypothetical protein
MSKVKQTVTDVVAGNDEPKPAPEVQPDSESPKAAASGGYDWGSMLLPDDAEGDLRTEEVLGVPRVKRPPNTQFFRCRKDLAGNINVLDMETEGERVTYLVAPTVAKQLDDETAIKAKHGRVCLTREGGLYLWLRSLGGSDTWSQSAARATDRAESNWVRATSSRSLSEYKCKVATGIDDEPNWPKESFIEILQAAFEGKVIDSLDHPAVKQLQGLS